MKGFEIYLNDEVLVEASLDTGFLPAILTINEDKADLSVSGLTSDSFEYLDYCYVKLNIGDLIRIKLTDFAHKSQPVKIRRRDRTEMIKEYFALKMKLENEGLL